MAIIARVVNPKMHTPDQTGAILDLFDGEISITQTDDPLECKKQIQVKKLRGQDYIKNPICMTYRALRRQGSYGFGQYKLGFLF